MRDGKYKFQFEMMHRRKAKKTSNKFKLQTRIKLLNYERDGFNARNALFKIKI